MGGLLSITAPGACCDGVMETVNDSRRRHAQKKAKLAMTSPEKGGEDFFDGASGAELGEVEDDEAGSMRRSSAGVEMDSFGVVRPFGELQSEEVDRDLDPVYRASGDLRRDYLGEVAR